MPLFPETALFAGPAILHVLPHRFDRASSPRLGALRRAYDGGWVRPDPLSPRQDA